MKLRLNHSGVLPTENRQNDANAFTLVEIAICLGIIGFALVAIIGVLPAGLQVQRDNREDTIINQEGTYLLEAIRNGAEELTNLAQRTEFLRLVRVDNGNISGSFTNLTAREVVGRLSTPVEFNSNEVRTVILAKAGNASDTPELGFKYQVTIRNYPYTGFSPAYPQPLGQALADRLRELRLDVRWPILPNGKVGAGRQLFRCLISGSITEDPPGSELFFIRQ